MKDDNIVQQKKMHIRVFIWSIISSFCSLVLSKTDPNCDRIINSTVHGEKNGTFSSPDWPNPYSPNLRCIYQFIGLPHERVQIRFLDFEVKGVPPRCLHDYVDVYTQVKDPFQDLLDIPLHGRYCGTGMDLLPRLLISMHNVFVLGFYSDHQKEEKGFNAEFAFIDGSVYNVGTPAPSSVCGQTIYGISRSVGIILSPTYPGMYPDNVFCFYRLLGVSGQRIRLTFLDVDLYSGGEHCPFDYIRVYDGPSNVSEVIGTYCGRMKDVAVYSSAESVYIEFVTKSGRVEPTKRANVPNWENTRTVDDAVVQRRGFEARFEISGQFVDLDFIREGQHVRGTECDQIVLSRNESTGTITSPNYPGNYPLNITCHYYMDGLEDKRNLEKAKLFIDEFDVPMVRDGCNNGHLSAYLRGQDITDEKPDHVFCGHILPNPLVTSNPRLLLVFNTTNARYSGRGFRAKFQFLTDYAIPGTAATDSAKCHFIYRSTAAVHGTFNSPRHPSNYPDNTSCLYEFIGLPNEQVRITFENFKLESNRPECNRVCGICNTDYVQVYSVFDRGLWENSIDKLTGQYCGEFLPGPQLSDAAASMLRVLFIANGEETNTGFRAKYEFVKQFGKGCFYNISTGGGGKIESPNYPHKYLINSTCDWVIYAKHRDARILLNFNIFSMEGNPEKQGCGNAVLKVYANNSGWPSHELCGTTSEGSTLLSQDNVMRLKFISSARAVGAKGFKLTWTEVLSITSEDSQCDGFRCKISNYCIARELKCNKLSNCGKGDTSDETAECGSSYQDHNLLHVVLGVVVSLVVIFILVIICFVYRRRRAQLQKDKKDIEVRYVTRAQNANRGSGGGGSTGMNCNDKLLKEKTEKVSIV